MRVLKYAGIILSAALLFMAGCATSENETSPPNWSATVTNNPVAPATNRPPWHPIPPPSRTNQTAVVHTNPPVQPQPAPILTWTSLDRWASENKIGAPQHLTSSPLSTWAFSSPAGTLVLALGSREVTWNRIILHLGLPPEAIDNQIFVHGLDLQKTIEPLLTGRTLDIPENEPVLVIDPGHGGINAGTLNVLGGHPEKDFTLDWAKRIVPLLATNGWRVYLTRTNDTDVSLSNRVAFATAHHANLFMSLHFNSSAPDKRQEGLETYCLTPTHMSSTLTRGYADVVTDVYPNNAYDVQNLLLAVRLHSAVLHASGEEDRGIRRARFMGVLQGLRCPGVLIEGGYLSNPDEAFRIEQPDFRQRLAEAVASALRLAVPAPPNISSNAHAIHT
jgi:N-acetylmuramoyl-L-alanine amidase